MSTSNHRSPEQRVRSRYSLRYDADTDRVELRVATRRGEPRAWFDRADLRAFTDHLHDFADDLDRKDRNA